MTPEERRMWIILRDGYDRNKVLKTKADVLRAVKISHRLKRVIEPLGPHIIKIANDVLARKQWDKYTYYEDMTNYAILMMLKSIVKFDVTKSTNVYAYLVTCCHGACCHYLNYEKKEQLIKEELLDRALNGQNI